MNDKLITLSSSFTSAGITYGTSTATSAPAITTSGVVAHRQKANVRSKEEKIKNAVYGYIQAIRALGRKSVDSTEISEALSLPARDVEKAMRNLRDRGVRLVE